MLLHVFISFIISMFFQNPTYEMSTSSVKYSMRHKLHSWEGVSKDLKVATKWNEQKNEIEQISIVVNVATFNSGLSNRDSHMLEVLDALTYPRILFSSSSVQYTPDGILVKGKLQFHGVERIIETKVKIDKVNSRWIFSGSLPILLEDYKVERPSLLFVKVDNLVQINFQVGYKDNSN
jgi:polyisoprenoid-binding protein YceI